MNFGDTAYQKSFLSFFLCLDFIFLYEQARDNHLNLILGTEQRRNHNYYGVAFLVLRRSFHRKKASDHRQDERGIYLERNEKNAVKYNR